MASVKSYPNSPHSEITVRGGLEFRFAPTGKQIIRYQLCEDNEGCTAIKTT